MRDTTWLALAMTVVAEAAELPSQADLIVELSDNVGIAKPMLAAAKHQARVLLANAGLRVQFIDCRPGGCEDSADPRVILVSIEDKLPSPRQPVLGYSLPFSDRANRATLNFGKIQKIAPSQTEFLLGTVMVHELAHLLFRTAAHDGGVMKEIWSVQDLRGIKESRLGFSKQQAVSLRNGLQSRLTGQSAINRGGAPLPVID